MLASILLMMMTVTVNMCHPLTPSNWEALPSIPIKEKVTAHRGSGRGRGHVTLRCCGSVRDLLPRDESEVLWEEPKQENIKVQL